MKAKLLLTTIAAMVLVGCGESQQSDPPPEVDPAELVAEAAQPESPTTKAPDISINKAATRGNIEAVKQHIAAGTDVNAHSYKGEYPPLHFAAMAGRKEIVELLVDAGADVNAKSEKGTTPLHYATVFGHREVAELLIAKGADVTAKSHDGYTPLDFAEPSENRQPPKVTTGKKETTDLLRKHGGKTGEELKAAEPVAEAAQPEPTTTKAPDISIHDAAEKGNLETVKQHLVAGVDLNAKGQHGGTPLHRATLEDHKEVVELLLVSAGVNVKSVNGLTPLDLAVSKGHKEIADLLRKHGGKTGKELKAEGK